MTVCIASIFNDTSILGASDRMITGGNEDITFEPPTPKILNISNSIFVMIAGDISTQTQIYERVIKEVSDKIKAEPEKWITVAEAAETYRKYFQLLKKKVVEDRVLSNYNLTFDSYIDLKNKNENSDFIEMLTDKIDSSHQEFEIRRGVETIVAGIDDTGPHIYVVENNEINCYDNLGFAAIGIGKSHALSHFMLSEHSKAASGAKALLTTHQAKKKSEISPGVGKSTDMCVLGPQKGLFNTIPRASVAHLDQFYKTYKKKIKDLDKETEVEIVSYIESLIGEPAPEQQMGASTSPSASMSESPSISPSASPSPST